MLKGRFIMKSLSVILMSLGAYLALGFSSACASSDPIAVRGTTLHTPEISCENLNARLFAEKAPDDTYIMALYGLRGVGETLQKKKYRDEVKSLIDIDETIMEATFKCSPDTGLPELIIPSKDGATDRILIIDNAGRISLRLEPK